MVVEEGDGEGEGMEMVGRIRTVSGGGEEECQCPTESAGEGSRVDGLGKIGEEEIFVGSDWTRKFDVSSGLCS